MGSSFELDTPKGNYNLRVATRNDYSDGALRVEPPIQASVDDFNLYIGDESGVFFHFPLAGKEATTWQFEIPENGDVVYVDGEPEDYRYVGPDLTKEGRARFAAEKLVSYLANIEDAEFFIENNSKAGMS